MTDMEQKEIGGYIELDSYHGELLHDSALALNCGRRCLTVLIRGKSIRRLLLPRFICDSVIQPCVEEKTEIAFYDVGYDFRPADIAVDSDQWLYLVNYYGQLSNEDIEEYAKRYEHVIVDNAQAYFRMPVNGVDTLYTCRKFFGVADGAFLYTDAPAPNALPTDESYQRMGFLLGRYERPASEFYAEYVQNNRLFRDEPAKRMSRLTQNLLRGIDYAYVRERRTENFMYLHERLGQYNRLSLRVPEGAFMYPLYVEHGAEIRKRLQRAKLYIPTLWPNVLAAGHPGETAYDMADNILPLPVDQRYDLKDMEYLYREVVGCID